MNTTTSPRLGRIQRVSGILRVLCTVFIILAWVVAALAAVAAVNGRSAQLAAFGQTIPFDVLSTASRAGVIALLFVSAAVMVKGLSHLRRLLANYARGEIFTMDSSRQIREFGISCILWGIVRILWAVIPALVLPHSPAAVQVDLDALPLGFVIVAISWFAEMAAALREENELTI